MGLGSARSTAAAAAGMPLDPRLLSRARVLATVGLVVIGLFWVATVAKAEPFVWGAPGTGHDARPYWEAAVRNPYAHSVLGAWQAYLYSPAFLQLIAPLRALPWTPFVAAWAGILVAAAALLAGPVLLAPVALVVAPELFGGNITLLLALAVVAGFRWPAAWSFVLLTKVTPGAGLLWFAFRREWRSLGIALAATLGIVGVSTLLVPGLWREWAAVLLSNAGREVTSGSIPLPFVVRFPAAVVLLAWGARSNRRWVVPVACLLALPVIWYGSLSLLVGVIPLAQADLARRWPILAVGWRDLLGVGSKAPAEIGAG